VSLEITVSDFKNHQICEFGQLWRLPEGEQCKIESFSSKYKLFKILFLTTFISIETLYGQIWNICQICQILEFFESWKSMLFKMTFVITFISTIRLCNQIWQSILPVPVPTAKIWNFYSWKKAKKNIVRQVDFCGRLICYSMTFKLSTGKNSAWYFFIPR